MTFHGLLAIWLVALSAIACAADPKLDKLLESWQADKERADAKLLRTFDREIGAVRKNRNLTAELRNQKIVDMKEQKAVFEKTGDVPGADDMLPATIA